MLSKQLSKQLSKMPSSIPRRSPRIAQKMAKDQENHKQPYNISSSVPRRSPRIAEKMVKGQENHKQTKEDESKYDCTPQYLEYIAKPEYQECCIAVSCLINKIRKANTISEGAEHIKILMKYIILTDGAQKLIAVYPPLRVSIYRMLVRYSECLPLNIDLENSPFVYQRICNRLIGKNFVSGGHDDIEVLYK